MDEKLVNINIILPVSVFSLEKTCVVSKLTKQLTINVHSIAWWCSGGGGGGDE